MKKRKWYLAVIIAAAICTGCRLIWAACKTDLIINLGARTWRMISIALTVLLAVSFGIAGLLVLRKLCQCCEQAKSGSNKAESETQKRPASLSIKGQLSTDTIAGFLTDTINGKNGDWAQLKLLFMECREELYKMDRYQEKLHVLLIENDAQKLDNTEEIVIRVEQYMLRNARKICNYVQIYDSSDEEGLAKITAQTQECLQDNQKQLEHVQDLLSAIADFLNGQGQDNSALETMEIYKNMMLESIEQEEKNV